VDLIEALREQIRSYVEGRSSLAALRSWLADHAQQVSVSRDPALNELDGLVWILISEHDYGHRDDGDQCTQFRTILARQSIVN